jgi:tetratricopeptide (TPR) repeat protein
MLVAWILLSVYTPALDSVTAHAPSSIRRRIGNLILSSGDSIPSLTRGVRFDPENADGWLQLCYASENQPDGGLKACQEAANHNSIAMADEYLGKAEEKVGNECKAEEVYTEAASKVANSGGYEYLQSMGRAALLCGDLPSSRAALEASVQNARNYLDRVPMGNDERASVTEELARSSHLLIVVYDRMKKPDLAVGMCKQAHADWKSCKCELDAKNKAVCHVG